MRRPYWILSPGKGRYDRTPLQRVYPLSRRIRQRRLPGVAKPPVFTTGEIDAYRASFLNTVRTKSRKSLHIDADLHRRISSLVWAVGRGEVTVAGFVNQVLAHHFEENGGLINAVLEKYYQSLKS
ncbi:DUF3408 domain-containing protein [Bacteroides thetaiotaomicron]|nr:DUF3408 domain-containing protein [Bacteroides thetaiotaomicron]